MKLDATMSACLFKLKNCDPWKGGDLVLHSRKLTGVHTQFLGFFKHSMNVSCTSNFSW